MSLIKNLVKETENKPRKKKKNGDSDGSDTEEKEKPVGPFLKSATDLQRLKLEKLMKNPEKPVIIPEQRREKDYMSSVPTFVRNVMGSSAGAGSGEFHVYRHLRRKEYARQKNIQNQSLREAADDAFQQKLDDNKRVAEERTAKKRAKRLKKKQRAKRPREQKSNEDKQRMGNESCGSSSEEEAEAKAEAVTSGEEVATKEQLETKEEAGTKGEVIKDQVETKEEAVPKEGAAEKEEAVEGNVTKEEEATKEEVASKETEKDQAAETATKETGDQIITATDVQSKTVEESEVNP